MLEQEKMNVLMRGTSQVISVEMNWTTPPMSEESVKIGREIHPPVWMV